jgi:hypothetical protein
MNTYGDHMSIADMDYEPDEEEQAVLDVLREHGRANPMLIREETDLRKEYVSRALTGLQKAGVVTKVTRGLYDHVPENDDEFTHDRVEVDTAALERALSDIEAAAERGNGNGLQDALDRAREVLNNDG